MKPINLRIAEELGVREQQVAATISLLDGGATVPFVARYRKEATGMLDDAQLRTLEERLRYLRELDERRDAIIASIAEQGKLTPELETQLKAADTKARLEDLYLPYKPKRRTRAQIAREAGLEPLADLLLNDPANDPKTAAADYLNDQVTDVAQALDGARAILVERFAEDAGVSPLGRPADQWLLDTVHWAWRTRILVHLGVDLRVRLWQAAEEEAVDVFASNVRDLLLAAPAGARPTLGLDPGFRTGVKV